LETKELIVQVDITWVYSRPFGAGSGTASEPTNRFASSDIWATQSADREVVYVECTALADASVRQLLKATDASLEQQQQVLD